MVKLVILKMTKFNVIVYTLALSKPDSQYIHFNFLTSFKPKKGEPLISAFAFTQRSKFYIEFDSV